MIINLEKIFQRLEDKAYKKVSENRKNKEKENDNKDESEKEKSTQKAKMPEIIAKECMKITEDIHGGNEDAKEADVGNGDEQNKNEKYKDILKKKVQDKINSEKVNKSESLEEIEENLRLKLENKIIDIIQSLSKVHSGDTRKTGYEKYDTKAIAKHISTGELSKILSDKYDKNDGRIVQFFIDSSGSNYEAYSGIRKAMKKLSKQGYVCYIADCGNGFSSEDLEDNPMYHTREKLKKFKGAVLNKILCPTEKTAKKMAENADFSIILADFDGLSSISYLSEICNKDKLPYFICTENRYDWSNADEHNWVDPSLCTYPSEHVFDIGYMIKDIEDIYQEINEERSEMEYYKENREW